MWRAHCLSDWPVLPALPHIVMNGDSGPHFAFTRETCCGAWLVLYVKFRIEYWLRQGVLQW